MANTVNPEIAAALKLLLGGAQPTEAAEEAQPEAEAKTVVVTNLKLVREKGDDEDAARITGFVPELNADCVVAGDKETAESILAVAKPGDATERTVDVPAANGKPAKKLIFVERPVLAVRVTAQTVGAVRVGKTATGKPRRDISITGVTAQKVGFKPAGKWAL